VFYEMTVAQQLLTQPHNKANALKQYSSQNNVNICDNHSNVSQCEIYFCR